MFRRILFVVMILLALGVPAAVVAQEDDMPEMVLAARTGFHPEGVDWDAERGLFVTGSIDSPQAFPDDELETKSCSLPVPSSFAR